MCLFGISYDTWKKVCGMYFTLGIGSQKAYLQWFPFTKLSSDDKKIISGEDFYNRYIRTASFMLFPPAMHQSENYLQKGDGSFRDSSLIAPILFLFLQSVGMEIHNQYAPIRPSDISVYYAGIRGQKLFLFPLNKSRGHQLFQCGGTGGRSAQPFPLGVLRHILRTGCLHSRKQRIL